MKTLIATLSLALAALTVSAQGVKQNSFTVTNDARISAILAPGTIFVDAVSGNDTNAGTISAPVATLTQGNALAVSGQTVMVQRGSFAETVYPTPGVDFYLAGGTVLSGGSGISFKITNSAAVLNVLGAGTFTNQVVMFDSVTGSVVSVSAKSLLGAGSSGASVYFYLGTSNRCYLNVTDTIEQKLCVWADEWAAHSYSNRVLNLWANVGKRFNANPYATTGAGLGHSNTVISVTAPEYYMNANGAFNLAAKIVFNGGQFSRDGKTLTSVGSNVWFRGVSCVSSNTDAGAAVFSNVRGNFWFENERTIISNP